MIVAYSVSVTLSESVKIEILVFLDSNVSIYGYRDMTRRKHYDGEILVKLFVPVNPWYMTRVEEPIFKFEIVSE